MLKHPTFEDRPVLIGDTVTFQSRHLIDLTVIDTFTGEVVGIKRRKDMDVVQIEVTPIAFLDESQIIAHTPKAPPVGLDATRWRADGLRCVR